MTVLTSIIIVWTVLSATVRRSIARHHLTAIRVVVVSVEFSQLFGAHAAATATTISTVSLSLSLGFGFGLGLDLGDDLGGDLSLCKDSDRWSLFLSQFRTVGDSEES